MIPLGKSFALLTKHYIGILSRKLEELDIDRHFYATYILSLSKEPMCQNDLANAVVVDKVTMVRMVDYLSEKGYVKKVKDVNDKRYHRLTLTAKGMKAVPVIEKAYRETDAQFLKGLDKKEKEIFHSLLDKALINAVNSPQSKVKLNFKRIK